MEVSQHLMMVWRLQPAGPAWPSSDGSGLSGLGFLIGMFGRPAAGKTEQPGESGPAREGGAHAARSPPPPDPSLARGLIRLLLLLLLCERGSDRLPLPTTHPDPSSSRPKPPSAIFSRLKAGSAQKSQAPGQITQVSAGSSSQKQPKREATLRQETMRETAHKHLTPSGRQISGSGGARRQGWGVTMRCILQALRWFHPPGFGSTFLWQTDALDPLLRAQPRKGKLHYASMELHLRGLTGFSLKQQSVRLGSKKRNVRRRKVSSFSTKFVFVTNKTSDCTVWKNRWWAEDVA